MASGANAPTDAGYFASLAVNTYDPGGTRSRFAGCLP
jgi:hypothetical protein